MFLRNWTILHIFTSLWILIFNKLWKHWFKFCNVHKHTLLYHYRECNVCHQNSSKILFISHNFQVGGFNFGLLSFYVTTVCCEIMCSYSFHTWCFFLWHSFLFLSLFYCLCNCLSFMSTSQILNQQIHYLEYRQLHP